jgi:hypothetical protein
MCKCVLPPGVNPIAVEKYIKKISNSKRMKLGDHEENCSLESDDHLPELNPICHLLALLADHHILHVSRIRVK